MYRDMQDCDWLKDKIRASRSYAQNLYAAMCNMQWQKLDVLPLLKDELWRCSWRSSGGIVAGLRHEGEDYLDYYCSGMGGLTTYDPDEGDRYIAEKQYVPEGTVTDEIRKDLARLGWIPVPYEDDII